MSGAGDRRSELENLNIVILDAATLGDDITFGRFERFGSVEVYGRTDERQIRFRAMDADVIIVNKLTIDGSTVGGAKRLKLICVTATGFDNIDLDYCRRRGIAVCNVRGYSTESVAQVTAAMALSLVTHIREYDDHVKSYEYSRSGVQNHLKPVFHELSSLTWGVVGLGNIGTRVADTAAAMGCDVLAYKRRPDPLYKCVPIGELCKKSDIISIHLPLSGETRGLIDRELIASMKKNAVVINVARGAVTDEAALTEAVREGRIGGVGIDVNTEEPMSTRSPYVSVMDMPNVIFTPHMAWGAYEARVRCMEEIEKNIESFLRGRKRNRVEV